MQGSSTSGTPDTPAALVPALLLRRGAVCVPSDSGPAPALTEDGAPLDPFDVLDRLTADYPLVYVVDLDGVETGDPQLDLLQELARDAAIWVDGGARNSDQAIDILVTGAQRAVLSSATLTSPRELRRAWKLSSEITFEVEVDPHGLVASPAWDVREPAALVRSVRELGPDHIVVSPREVDPDWELIRGIAAGGPTWVGGSFAASDLARLRGSGARGGIFHIDRLLAGTRAPPRPASSRLSSTPRDDET